MTRAARLLLVLATALVGVPSALAQEQPEATPPPSQGPDIIERVVAVVNDDAIFLSELRRRALPFLRAVLEQTPPEERDATLRSVYRQVLDALIDESLIEQVAREDQLRVTQADVERAIGNVRNARGLSDEQFWAAVRQQGYTEAQYRDERRRELLIFKVLNQRRRGNVNITEDQVRVRYDQEARRAERSTCYALSVRVFRAPEGADEAEQARACEEAGTVRSAVTAETFGGTDIGTVCEGAMLPQIEEAVAELEQGEISQPIRTESGCMLALVRERARGATEIPSYEDVRERLYRQMMTEAMQRQQQQLAEELRRGAVIERRL
jgi:peptidyl-prolyl cis-trans isomerase SurA